MDEEVISHEKHRETCDNEVFSVNASYPMPTWGRCIKCNQKVGK